jgi:hypothetical protein
MNRRTLCDQSPCEKFTCLGEDKLSADVLRHAMFLLCGDIIAMTQAHGYMCVNPGGTGTTSGVTGTAAPPSNGTCLFPSLAQEKYRKSNVGFLFFLGQFFVG